MNAFLLYCINLVFKGAWIFKTEKIFLKLCVGIIVTNATKVHIKGVINNFQIHDFIRSIHFFPWSPLKFSDFVMVDMNIWWLKRSVLKLSGNLKRFFLIPHYSNTQEIELHTNLSWRHSIIRTLSVVPSEQNLWKFIFDNSKSRSLEQFLNFILIFVFSPFRLWVVKSQL